MTEKTLADLEKELIEATHRYEDAKREASTASLNETMARNRLNDAQKAIDARLVELRKSAPAGDWRDNRTTKVSINA